MKIAAQLHRGYGNLGQSCTAVGEVPHVEPSDLRIVELPGHHLQAAEARRAAS